MNSITDDGADKREQMIYDGLCPRCAGDVEHHQDTWIGGRKYESMKCIDCGLIFDLRMRRVLVAEYEDPIGYSE